MTPSALRDAAGKAEQFAQWARFSADDPRPERVAQARAELLEALGLGWQPIETAPKDGTLVLLAGHLDGPHDWRIKMGFFRAHEEKWELFGGSWRPVRWMPLPEPPL